MRRLILAAALVLAGCTSLDSFVFDSRANGSVEVRTDGEFYFVVGAGEGLARVFLKGSGMPLTIPYEVDEGAILFGYLGGESWTVESDTPWPARAAELFAPGEAEERGIVFAPE